MTGHERITAALRGEPPDVVPVMLHNFMMAAAEAGISMQTFRRDARAMARAFIESIERYELDGIMIDLDTAVLAGAAGVEVDFPEHEPARWRGPALTSLAAVEGLEPVSLAADSRVAVWLEATQLIKDYFGDQVFVRGNADQCPYSIAGMMRGPEAWMMDLIDRRELPQIRRLLDYCLALTNGFLELMAATGCDMLSNGDSPAGPDMISPAMYREFAWPWEQQVVRKANELGLPYALHICGDASLILTDMVATGADCLELDYKTDVHTARQALPRTVFIGNIDPSGVLALGSVAEVERVTRELLAVFVGQPRFILNAGCAIPAATPPANLRAMIRTARDFA